MMPGPTGPAPPTGGPAFLPHPRRPHAEPLPPVFDRRPASVRPVACLALAALIAALTGCGDGKIKRYPVSGSITVAGKPYEGARVFLFPLDGSEAFQKERPFGVTDESGAFSIMTFVKDDGAPAGTYKVIVMNDPPADADQAKRWRGRPQIDAQFSNPDTTPLTAEVTSGINQLEPFALDAATARR